MSPHRYPAFCLLLAALAVGAPAASESWDELEALIDGPAPPAHPETIARDPEGRATVRAIRLQSPLSVYGALEEEVYETIRPIDGFIQQNPQEGEPATETTEAWLFFDDQNLYVSARLWDSQPERILANEMRRDHRNLSQNDNFGVSLDTFYDRRNAFLFHCTPAGGFHDGLITDERTFNSDWNTVVTIKTSRFEQGWTVEMEIPFKSLRYGTSPVWGVNFRRRIPWKNEFSYLTPIPASFGFRSSPQPMPFFSRRIGLGENAEEDDVMVPIRAGARLTGKAGPFGIGAIHIRTGEDESATVPAAAPAARIRQRARVRDRSRMADTLALASGQRQARRASLPHPMQ